MHIFSIWSVSHSSRFSLFLQYILKKTGPRSDDCTVWRTAPMTNRSHRSILWCMRMKMVYECVASDMTCTVQYNFWGENVKIHHVHMVFNCFTDPSEGQVCRYPFPDTCYSSVNPWITCSPTSMSPTGHSCNKPLARGLTTSERPPRVSLDEGEGRTEGRKINTCRSCLSEIKITSTD